MEKILTPSVNEGATYFFEGLCERALVRHCEPKAKQSDEVVARAEPRWQSCYPGDKLRNLDFQLINKLEIAEPVPNEVRNLRVCVGFASQPLRSSR